MLAVSNLAALLVASAALAVGATPSSQPIPEAGNTFCVYPGWDMDNGNYVTVPNITELACLRACRDSVPCLACAYVPDGSNRGPGEACYLKNAVNLTTFTNENGYVNTAIPGPCDERLIFLPFIPFLWGSLAKHPLSIRSSSPEGGNFKQAELKIPLNDVRVFCSILSGPGPCDLRFWASRLENWAANTSKILSNRIYIRCLVDEGKMPAVAYSGIFLSGIQDSAEQSDSTPDGSKDQDGSYGRSPVARGIRIHLFTLTPVV
ncbi:hypothetical protein DFH08DRAFT_802441 [Mycena albidolilacea]|uniref:Apple domain-containing protein n=1 Tax=Mycena albidolilacea TaxID=1033008 RepID=A0AAD7ADX8_9AGAR|nr:hypothetical protein DFH08DRAFT_802441 [Mycena albidolilacea]